MAAVIVEDYQLTEGKYIYNHDTRHGSQNGISGKQLDSARALGISESWDMIQLDETLQLFWHDITEHYERIGLSHSTNVIWSLNLKHLGSHIGYQPSVYHYGPEACHYWGDNQWLNTVEYINSKNNFILTANNIGVDVPMTLCFKAKSSISIDDLQDITFPCYIKTAITEPGIGVYRCENKTQLFENFRKIDSNIPLQIQEEVKTNTFLNLQYKVVGKGAVRLNASELIVNANGYSYQGNHVPATHKPWHIVDPMAEWLVTHGLKGVFTFTLAITQTPSGLRFPVLECVPGFNDDAYPGLIAEKLNIKEWSTRGFATKYRHLDKIDLRDIEYDHQTGEGAVLVNWGTVLNGYIEILLAGSSEYQEALAIELQARL
ncbi:MAG: ATP-grasp domain-containing protein [Thioalkalispiraceae bacterium]|jgi:hypothetical protein